MCDNEFDELDDDDYDDSDEFDCHYDGETCELAGSEACEFMCPYREEFEDAE